MAKYTYYPRGNGAVHSHYVYYSTLLDGPRSYNEWEQSAKMNKIMNSTGQGANIYLSNQQLFESSNSLSDMSMVKQFENALNFLKQAISYERNNEIQFLNYLYTQSDYLKENCQIPNITNEGFDYKEFISQINIGKRGYQESIDSIHKEIRRIEVNKTLCNKYRTKYTDFKTGKLKPTDQTSIDIIKDMQELGFSPEQLLYTVESGEERDYAKKVGSNSYINKALEGIAGSERSDLGKIATALLQKQSGLIFSLSSNGLELDPARAAAVIQQLQKAVYSELKKRLAKLDKSQKITANQKRALIDDIITNPSKDNMYTILLDQISTDQNMFLYQTSQIEKRYNIHTDEKAKNYNKLERRLRNAYLYEKQQGHFTGNFKDWQDKTGVNEVFMQSLAAISQNTTIELYYNSETKSFMEDTNNALKAAIVGGAGKADDIISRGYIEINTNLNEAIEQNINKTLNNQNDQKRRQMRDKIRNNNPKHQQKDLIIAGFERDLDMQQQYLRKQLEYCEEELNILNEYFGERDSSNFVVHTSVKDYATIGSSTSSFSGASFGNGSIEEQAVTISSMVAAAGLNTIDSDWLVNVAINTKEGLMGEGLKGYLEDFLSIFGGFLMFDDTMTQVTRIATNAKITEGPMHIDIYRLNRLYVPQSYVLQLLYDALKESYNQASTLASSQKAMRITITNGYTLQDSFYQEENGKPVRGYDEDYGYWNDFELEGQKALKATKMKISFLADFLQILNDVFEQMRMK